MPRDASRDNQQRHYLHSIASRLPPLGSARATVARSSLHISAHRHSISSHRRPLVQPKAEPSHPSIQISTPTGSSMSNGLSQSAASEPVPMSVYNPQIRASPRFGNVQLSSEVTVPPLPLPTDAQIDRAIGATVPQARSELMGSCMLAPHGTQDTTTQANVTSPRLSSDNMRSPLSLSQDTHMNGPGNAAGIRRQPVDPPSAPTPLRSPLNAPMILSTTRTSAQPMQGVASRDAQSNVLGCATASLPNTTPRGLPQDAQSDQVARAPLSHPDLQSTDVTSLAPQTQHLGIRFIVPAVPELDSVWQADQRSTPVPPPHMMDVDPVSTQFERLAVMPSASSMVSPLRLHPVTTAETSSLMNVNLAPVDPRRIAIADPRRRPALSSSTITLSQQEQSSLGSLDHSQMVVDSVSADPRRPAADSPRISFAHEGRSTHVDGAQRMDADPVSVDPRRRLTCPKTTHDAPSKQACPAAEIRESSCMIVDQATGNPRRPLPQPLNELLPQHRRSPSVPTTSQMNIDSTALHSRRPTLELASQQRTQHRNPQHDSQKTSMLQQPQIMSAAQSFQMNVNSTKAASQSLAMNNDLPMDIILPPKCQSAGTTHGASLNECMQPKPSPTPSYDASASLSPQISLRSDVRRVLPGTFVIFKLDLNWLLKGFSAGCHLPRTEYDYLRSTLQAHVGLVTEAKIRLAPSGKAVEYLVLKFVSSISPPSPAPQNHWLEVGRGPGPGLPLQNDMIFPFPGMKQWTSAGATVFVTECNESSSSHDYVLTGTALEQVQERIAQDNLGTVANCGDLTTTQTVAAPAFSPGQAETQPIAPPVRIWKDIRKWPLHPNSPSAFEREQELVDSLIKLHVARNTQVSYVRPQP